MVLLLVSVRQINQVLTFAVVAPPFPVVDRLCCSSRARRIVMSVLLRHSDIWRTIERDKVDITWQSKLKNRL